MKKATVIRGEHEHAVQMQGNEPVAQSKRNRSGGKSMEDTTPKSDRKVATAAPNSGRSVTLPKPRPTPKVSNAKPVSRFEAKVAAVATVMDAGTVLTPEQVWDAESQILQRLSALKTKNQQLSAQIQRLTAIADTLPGKGSES